MFGHKAQANYRHYPKKPDGYGVFNIHTLDGVPRITEGGKEMNREKTIVEWLEELPDGYRELALKNYDPEYCDTGVNIIDLADALVWGFSWEDTPEGQVFWDAVYEWARCGLPPLPEEGK